MIIINLKTYKYGSEVLKLAKVIEKSKKNIILGAQPTDIYFLSKNTSLEVYSQHVDNISPGRETGFISPQSIKSAGAKGVFLNHSEHPLDFSTLKESIKKCKKINLKTVVFVPNLNLAKKVEKLNPNFIIYEPVELVAGKVSISKSQPEMIERLSRSIKIPFLVGAGVKNKEDINIANKMGAKGVAVSSIITKSKNPIDALKKLGIL